MREFKKETTDELNKFLEISKNPEEFISKNQNENLNMDKNSIDILRKLAFLKLIDASKKYYVKKIQGKDIESLNKTKEAALKLYSDYKNIKRWTENK